MSASEEFCLSRAIQMFALLLLLLLNVIGRNVIGQYLFSSENCLMTSVINSCSAFVAWLPLDETGSAGKGLKCMHTQTSFQCSSGRFSVQNLIK